MQDCCFDNLHALFQFSLAAVQIRVKQKLPPYIYAITLCDLIILDLDECLCKTRLLVREVLATVLVHAGCDEREHKISCYGRLRTNEIVEVQ